MRRLAAGGDGLGIVPIVEIRNPLRGHFRIASRSGTSHDAPDSKKHAAKSLVLREDSLEKKSLIRVGGRQNLTPFSCVLCFSWLIHSQFE